MVLTAHADPCATLSPCGRGRGPAAGREGEGAARRGAGSPLTLPLLRNGPLPLPQGERAREWR